MSELPCYTILSLPTDLEAPNEQQLKTDLEKGEVNFSLQIKVVHNYLSLSITATFLRILLPM